MKKVKYKCFVIVSIYFFYICGLKIEIEIGIIKSEKLNGGGCWEEIFMVVGVVVNTEAAIIIICYGIRVA